MPNDVFTTAPGQIRILNVNRNAKYYYAQGYKTAAQMKYAKGFDASVGFGASQKGILHHSCTGRGQKNVSALCVCKLRNGGAEIL